MGIAALVVDAKDDHAAAFYAHFGFIALAEQRLTLFLSLDSLRLAAEHLVPQAQSAGTKALKASPRPALRAVFITGERTLFFKFPGTLAQIRNLLFFSY